MSFRYDSKIVKDGETHVVACNHFGIKAFTDRHQAEQDASDRNLRAENLGIKARYSVASIESGVAVNDD